MAAQGENCYFFTAEGLTANPDGIHLNAISQRKLGLRYYQAFSKKQSVFKPLDNEEKWQEQLEEAPTATIEMCLLSKKFVLGKISQEEFFQAAGKLM
ncbi:hypothetical protein [Enterococcus pallens]|uniref:hypothetical protein n=1 Tax=Enterococcus pallens TaxID=160454 RepID=UPI0003A06296|nr:hypothetical protein [Enterococcus pallens]OJG78452.1 hypothetical protein RV10_GL001447 [Enterococcus pallens]